jgi:hypothetical protein
VVSVEWERGGVYIIIDMSPYNVEVKRGFYVKDFIALALPLFLGVVAWGVWLYEITQIVGWAGLEWLRVELYSVYVITGITVLSYLLPIFMWSRAKWYWNLTCFLGMYLAGLGGYWSGRYLLTQLYSRIPHEHHISQLWALFLVLLIVSSVFFFLKQYFLFRSGSFHVLTLMAVFIAVVPASLGTVEWFPGFGSMHSFVDAVKMGYPIFWVNLFLGWTAYAMVKKLI